jgi:NAD(P)H-flavin reductase
MLTIDTSLPMTTTPTSILARQISIPTAGITFFIRQRGGLTKLLASGAQIPVFVESSYGSLSPLRTHPSMIAIAGGVGIVTVLPLLRIHPGQSKLYWGLRTQGLLDALTDDLEGVDKEVFVGQRMDVRTVLEKEIGGDRGKGAVVVVSGPAALADEVRAAICELGKKEGAWPVKLVDESFG